MVNKTLMSPIRFVLGLICGVLLSACQNAEDLIHAARFDDLVKLRECVESGVCLDHADPAGETALFHTIGMGSTEAFRLLLEHGANVHHQDFQGNTVLHKAMTYNQSQMALELIKRGLGVNVTNKVGGSALHYAVRGANHEMVSLLLSQGADTRLINSEGNTPLEILKNMYEREGLFDTMGRSISREQIIKTFSALTNTITNK